MTFLACVNVPVLLKVEKLLFLSPGHFLCEREAWFRYKNWGPSFLHYIGCRLENCHFINAVSLGQIANMSFLQGSFELCFFLSSDWTFHKAKKHIIKWEFFSMPLSDLFQKNTWQFLSQWYLIKWHPSTSTCINRRWGLSFCWQEIWTLFCYGNIDCDIFEHLQNDGILWNKVYAYHDRCQRPSFY